MLQVSLARAHPQRDHTSSRLARRVGMSDFEDFVGGFPATSIAGNSYGEGRRHQSLIAIVIGVTPDRRHQEFMMEADTGDAFSLVK
jgi:hypothetical protein